jgi:hypothetical protein
LLASGDINDRGVITGLACVLVSGACSGVLHSFVAIVAPAVAATLAPSGAEAAARPAVPAEVRARVRQQQRLGRMMRGPSGQLEVLQTRTAEGAVAVRLSQIQSLSANRESSV